MATTKKRAFEKHDLVPVHEKISDSEKEKLMQELNVNFKDLPKISRNDPAIIDDASIKTGDIIRVKRKSSTAKEVNFYRGVIDA